MTDQGGTRLLSETELQNQIPEEEMALYLAAQSVLRRMAQRGQPEAARALLHLGLWRAVRRRDASWGWALARLWSRLLREWEGEQREAVWLSHDSHRAPLPHT